MLKFIETKTGKRNKNKIGTTLLPSKTDQKSARSCKDPTKARVERDVDPIPTHMSLDNKVIYRADFQQTFTGFFLKNVKMIMSDTVINDAVHNGKSKGGLC